ncbi:MAG: TonB family protein [Deltaproteobacteria bacterium]|nr:MAG: TonB family protein [Deltaproteobacteria bacterium]
MITFLALFSAPAWAQETPPAEPAPTAAPDEAPEAPASEAPASEEAPPAGSSEAPANEDAAPTEPAEPPAPEDAPAEPVAPPTPEAPPAGTTAPEPYTGDVPIEELPILQGPQIVEYVEAPYPPEAEAAGIEGTVLLLIEIDETGTVTYVEVLQEAGNGFDEPAAEAARQMTFTPAMTEAGPVPVAFEFAYGFKLSPEDEVVAPEGGEGEGEQVVEPPPPPVNADGILREMGTRNPVAGALITIEGTDIEAETDEEGRFELRGVPLGKQVLRALKPGYAVLDTSVEVEEGLVTSATYWIRAESYRDNEAVAVYSREKTEVTKRTITIEEIRRVPGTFGDPLKVVQTLPGAARSPFGTGLLVIRGSNPEDSGVYVDGIRIPIIYHLTGTTSVLSPDLIDSVDYLPGSYGVQYGRSMGGVVDVKTKNEFAENGKIVWGTDILDSQLYYEGQIGKEGKKHGLAIGARRSYIDAFIPIFTGGSDFTLKPRYWDYQVKWVPHLEGDREAAVFLYGFNDLLEVRTPDDVAQGSDQDTQGGLRTEYMSHRLVAQYKDQITPKTRLELTPSIGFDYSDFGLGDEFSLSSTNWLIELRGQTPIAFNDHVELVPGIDFIGGPWGFDFRSPFGFTDLDDPLAEREPVGFDGRGTGWSADPFVKLNLRPLDDPEKLLITPGVRYNNFLLTYSGSITGNDDGAGTTYFSQSVDPRLLARWQVTEDIALKGATGLYTQPAQPFEAIGIGTTADLGYESAWNSSIGIEQNLSQAVKWELELYYKQMDKLIVFDESFTGAGMQTFVNAGAGRAYGAEVILRHEPVDRLFGWVSYTLSRSIRHDGPDADWKPFNKANLDNGWYPFDFDQTHIFSAQAGYDLPKDFGVSAQVQYVTGNPDYPSDAGVYDADGDFYNGFSTGTQTRLPPFFQTSLRFDKLFTFKRWQMEAYVDLLNAVRGVNPEFTTYAYDYSEYAYVRGLPFIPNIGLEAKFHL